MNLTKWNPAAELEEVSKRLNRIFRRSPSPAEPGHDPLIIADWSPSTDISETDAAYLIKSEIPGVDREDVKIHIVDGMLTIQGERKMEKEEKSMKFHRLERVYGRFARSFRIPGDADEAAVKAEFKDGMLNVTLSKFAKVKAPAIDVAVM